MRSRRIPPLLWLAVPGLAVFGCEGSGAPGDSPAAMVSRSLAASDPAEAKPSHEVWARSPGKPLPPIEVDYTIEGVPSVGQPLEIRLHTSVRAELAALNLALAGSERLHVPIEVARLRQAFAAANERRMETIRVTPLAPGRHYLSVLAEAEIGGRVQARSVTIPIDVAGAAATEPTALPPAGAVAVDAEGTRIISLPARSN